MNLKLIIIYLIALQATKSFIDITYNGDEEEQSPEFQIKLIFIQLKQIKNKKYESPEEEEFRFQIFKQNVQECLGTLDGIKDKYKIILVEIDKEIKKRLVIKGSNPCEYKMDLNKFIDMTKEEFSSLYLLPEQFFDEENYKPEPVLSDDQITKEDLDKALNDTNFNVFHEKLQFQITGKLSENLTDLQIKIVQSIPTYEANNQNPEIVDEKIIDTECEIYQNELMLEQAKINQETEGRRLQYYNQGYYGQPTTTYSQPSVTYTQPTTTYTSPSQSFYRQPTTTYSQPTRRNNYRQSNVTYSQPRTTTNYRTNNNNYFRNYYNTATPANPFQRTSYQPQSRKTINAGGLNIPSYINWRSKKSFTPVKDQRTCNSCYAFGATSALEAHNALKYNNYSTFSEQEILDCSSRNLACTGGQPFLVFDYIINQGVSYDREYPYQSRKMQCRKNQTSQRYRGLKGYYFVPTGILSLLKAVNTGPVVVVSYASDYMKYQYNGIFKGQGCNPYQRPNHASLLYGYDLNAPVPYLMFKNNWGTFWGNAGYYKVAIGQLSNSNKGHCLIAQTSYNVIPVLNQFIQSINKNDELSKTKRIM